MLLFLAALLAFQDVSLPALAGPVAPKLDPALGKVSSLCRTPKDRSDRHVWIFKQWHLAPSVETRDLAKALPQAANQAAVYRQLDAWIRKGALKSVVSEGCEGELTLASTIRFNGWSAQDLAKASGEPHYDDQVVSSVPLKLEARHGDAVRTVCGDDPELIRESGLALSDARGALGFITRLEQYRDQPERAKTYLEGVIELYRLPKDTAIPAALERLKTELKKSVARARAAIERRNEKAVQAALALPPGQAAIVYGGLHAPGLVKLLEERGVGCSVVEPAGYEDAEAQIMSRLEALFERM